MPSMGMVELTIMLVSMSCLFYAFQYLGMGELTIKLVSMSCLFYACLYLGNGGLAGIGS
jgi:hypothetical protein